MSVKSTISSNPIYLGETIRLSILNVTDNQGSPIVTPNSITLVIQRPDNSTATTVSTAQIANDGGGNYHCDYTIGASEQFGTWQAKWTFVNGVYTGEFAIPFTVNQFNAIQG